MAHSLNAALGPAGLGSEAFDRAFVHCWPDLERSIKAMPTVTSTPQPGRRDSDVLAEVLSVVRKIEAREQRESEARAKHTLSRKVASVVAKAAREAAIRQAFQRGLKVAAEEGAERAAKMMAYLESDEGKRLLSEAPKKAPEEG